MKIQPRQELLAVWKSIAKWSLPKKDWVWDGRDGRNSISDAEQLLCLLHPPTRLREIRFDRPDTTSQDVFDALGPLGGPAEIPQRVVRLIGEFMERYTDPDTRVPVFPGGTYFTTSDVDGGRVPTAAQQQLEVVDAFATSVVLCTAVIEFLRGYRRSVQRAVHTAEVDAVEEATNRRLTAAMVGLLRSFTVNVFRTDSSEGRALCRTVSQRDELDLTFIAELRERLRDVIAGLRELGIAQDDVADLTDNQNLLFECGWSWGVLRNAEPISTPSLGEVRQPGFAEAAPYLYFTVVAVDGIRDLFGGRARIRGLLNEEQQVLLRTLQLQWELARRYWSTIASFGGGRWPLEDLPWRTTDEDETDYYSLLVTSLVLTELLDRRAPDTDLARIARILEDLADRSRVRRRPLAADPALTLHDPGTRISLVGSDNVEPDAPVLHWTLSDVSTLLLGRALAVADQVNDPRLRARLLDLADVAWAHLVQRRLTTGRGAGLWDQPGNVFRSLPQQAEEPSWYYTARVVQCLGTATTVIQGKPPVGERLTETAADLLVEAEDLYDEELLRGSGQIGEALQDTMRQQATNLRRARRILRSRPGAAVALICEVLRELDKLAATREPEVGE